MECLQVIGMECLQVIGMECLQVIGMECLQVIGMECLQVTRGVLSWLFLANQRVAFRASVRQAGVFRALFFNDCNINVMVQN